MEDTGEKTLSVGENNLLRPPLDIPRDGNADDELLRLYLLAPGSGIITDMSSSSCLWCDAVAVSASLFFSSPILAAAKLLCAKAFRGFILRSLFVIIAVVTGEKVESVGEEYRPPRESGSC